MESGPAALTIPGGRAPMAMAVAPAAMDWAILPETISFAPVLVLLI
jgi:hypothetical protein